VYHNFAGGGARGRYHRRLVGAFDYIIVGAGSAGCVLANRLSAARSSSVLVLEAGGSDAHWTIDMPLAFMKAFLNPTFGWG
jgi:choline dehydrogenase